MERDAIVIDGSQGEGGGQIVRSSLALALVTGRPVTVERIRAGREKPGLMRQHVTAVQAAVAVSGGKAQGAEIGSRSLTFTPAAVRPGEYEFRVGTAGSATLVLQTVLPALLVAEGPSRLVLEGGTHNPWAPPYDFLERAFLPLVNRMGPNVVAKLEQHGFYPVGGGRFVVTIEPARSLRGFELVERGAITQRHVIACSAKLPDHVCEREVQTILAKMSWDPGAAEIQHVRSQGPGNVVYVALTTPQVTEVFTGFGRRGIRAETVADEVVRQVCDYLTADVPVGPYLADQLMLPLGVAAWQARNGGAVAGGCFRTLPLSLHAETHLKVLRRFLDISISVEPSRDGGACLVSLRSNATLDGA